MKKLFLFIITVGLTATVLCSCTNPPNEEKAGIISDINYTGYAITIPDGLSVVESMDGTLFYLRDHSEVVAGIIVIPYGDTNVFTKEIDNMDKAMTEAGNGIKGKISDELKDLYHLTVSEKEVERAFTLNKCGSFSFEIVQGEETYTHYFFPVDDVVYDLFVLNNELTQEEKSMLLDGFDLGNPEE